MNANDAKTPRSCFAHQQVCGQTQGTDPDITAGIHQTGNRRFFLHDDFAFCFKPRSTNRDLLDKTLEISPAMSVRKNLQNSFRLRLRVFQLEVEPSCQILQVFKANYHAASSRCCNIASSAS